jgi:hypothetical protein
MSEPGEEPAIGAVVLGMGRSGTSAVTEMLVAAGFSAGRERDLMAADRHNPRGYWENLRIWELNEEILGRLGGSWFAPPPEEAQRTARDWATARLEGALTQLVAHGDGAPVALKDPRVGVMMTLWAPIIARYLHPVLVIRDPLEIAQSLCLRDATPVPFALASWELHLTALVRHLRDRVVTVAPYRELLGSPDLPRRLVAAVAGHLTDDCARVVRPEAAGAALDPTLRRRRAAVGEQEQELTGRQLALWRMLAGLEAGDQRLRAPGELLRPNPTARACVAAEAKRLQQAEQAAARERQMAATLHECGTLAQRLEAASDATRSLTMTVTAERARAETAATAQRQAEDRLEVMQASWSWRLTAPLRAGRRRLRAPAERVP